MRFAITFYNAIRKSATNVHTHMHVIWQYDSKCVFSNFICRTIFKSMQKLNTHTRFFFKWHMAKADDIDSITTSALIHMLFSRKYIDGLRATFLVSFFNLYFHLHEQLANGNFHNISNICEKKISLNIERYRFFLKGSILLFPIEDDATIRNAYCYVHTYNYRIGVPTNRLYNYLFLEK